MRRITTAIFSLGLLTSAAHADTASAGPERVKLTGEIIDSWCQISGTMGAGTGTAHHQCAIGKGASG